MKVFANGFPKAGNHALLKALGLLGIPAGINHVPFSLADRDFRKVIFIKRDPRNIIMSWLRFNGEAVTPGMFLTRFRRFQDRSLIDEMGEFEGWLNCGAFVVAYEDLISKPEPMQEIALRLRVPYLAGAFEALPSHTRTWNAVHSDYRMIWTEEVGAAWNTEGGDALLRRWGY